MLESKKLPREILISTPKRLNKDFSDFSPFLSPQKINFKASKIDECRRLEREFTSLQNEIGGSKHKLRDIKTQSFLLQKKLILQKPDWLEILGRLYL